VRTSPVLSSPKFRTIRLYAPGWNKGRTNVCETTFTSTSTCADICIEESNVRMGKRVEEAAEGTGK
jgi:hypothetical protein